MHLERFYSYLISFFYLPRQEFASARGNMHWRGRLESRAFADDPLRRNVAWTRRQIRGRRIGGGRRIRRKIGRIHRVFNDFNWLFVLFDWFFVLFDRFLALMHVPHGRRGFCVRKLCVELVDDLYVLQSAHSRCRHVQRIEIAWKRGARGNVWLETESHRGS